MTEDSRLTQIAAALDDARTLCADILEESPDDGELSANLVRVRNLINMALPYLLTDRCERYMSTGGRCDLQAGHDGSHAKTYETATYTWTDEDTRRFADRYGSRFD